MATITTPTSDVQLTSRLSTLSRTHRFPEESVVYHLSSVIELRGGLTAIPGLEHNLFDGHLLHVSSLDLSIEVVHVSSMMLSVVELKSTLFVSRY